MQTDASALSSRDLVDQLYEALLGRAPDELALTEKTGRLDNGTTTVRLLIAEIMGSDEYRDRTKSGSDGRFTRDCSQFGETWLLLREMVNEGATARYVVEVGARGRDRSNSYDLMAWFGWRGLLVEANPALVPQIKAEFDGLDYRLVNVAVSDYNGKAQFTIGVNDDVSSLKPEAALSWGPTRGVIEVEVRRLRDVLNEHRVPDDFDLLSIDIEGEDVKVINDLVDHSSYRPKWVVIEASYDFRTETLEEIGASRQVCSSYRIFQRTVANLLLRRTT